MTIELTAVSHAYGVGAARRVSAVRWNVASSIVVAWVVTLPAAALVGAMFYGLAGVVG